ncbi:MAG: hypothetical protein KBT05_03450 [Bacteroidales bacterium]|nr:hypothetical protein [Candidatus Cryptobacteroides caccocaballi]
MKGKFVVTALAVVLFSSFAAHAQSTEGKTPDLDERCEMQADRLELDLKLEPWQTFRVDSTLKAVYHGMTDEINDMQAAKIGNTSLYQQVQDKWLDRLDEAYMKIFTEDQWNEYLKRGAARLRKARDKRREKLEQSAVQKKK